MRSLLRARKPLEIALVALLVAGPAAGETPEEKGLVIATEADRRESGFGDSEVELEMVLRNAVGQESRRKLRIRTLEIEAKGEGDRTFVVFDEPRDVAGTALLTWTHIEEQDDQWLFLPALKRVKRISSKNKSGPFMGSEFAYEDFSSQEVEKYEYEYLRDEPCGDLSCFVVERVPVYEHSGYTKQIVWIDQSEYRYQRVEFYDRKNAHLKTLVFTKYEKYLDKLWRAHEFSMENHQTKKSTSLFYGPFEFQKGLTERDFEKAALKRVR